MRKPIIALAAVALLACSDGTGPDSAYPALGLYSFSASFQHPDDLGLTREYAGTLRITRADDERLEGSFDLGSRGVRPASFAGDPWAPRNGNGYPVWIEGTTSVFVANRIEGGGREARCVSTHIHNLGSVSSWQGTCQMEWVGG